MMWTPTLEPSLIGLTTHGRSIQRPASISSREAMVPSTMGMPTLSNTRLAATLSIARAEARTPEWV